MKDSRQNPSLFQIIWTDYPAFLACAVAIVAWIVYFAWIPDWRGRGPVIPPSVAPFYLTLAIVATVVGLGGLGVASLLPALSVAGALRAAPCLRFHIPLIEPGGPY